MTNNGSASYPYTGHAGVRGRSSITTVPALSGEGRVLTVRWDSGHPAVSTIAG